jgi:ABC-2 type transport system ATP-binding protein
VTGAPVLAAVEARIAVDGVTAIERLTLTTIGDRVLVAGDPRALFAALTGVPVSSSGAARAAPGDEDDAPPPGEACVVGGTLALVGRSVEGGAHVAVMGAAPLDPPLPARWTAEAYVAWGARLAGVSRWSAGDLATAALARVGLSGARRKALGTLTVPERRALVLAQAAVTGPEVLVAEAPLAGLEGAAASFVLAAITGATEGRKAVLSAVRLSAGTPEGVLARGASHLVVIAGGEIAVEGPPGELFAAARVISLTVRSNAGALRTELLARGIDLRGGPVRFAAALPAGVTSREILVAATVARAAVVEMVPVLG